MSGNGIHFQASMFKCQCETHKYFLPCYIGHKGHVFHMVPLWEDGASTGPGTQVYMEQSKPSADPLWTYAMSDK